MKSEVAKVVTGKAGTENAGKNLIDTLFKGTSKTVKGIVSAVTGLADSL